MKENHERQQLKEKLELTQRKLNAKIAEQQEEIRRLKKREEERKVKETEEKTENRRKLDSMRDTLQTRNKRIADQKSEMNNHKAKHVKEMQEIKLELDHYKDKEKQANKENSLGAKNGKGLEKQKKELENAREENRKLALKLKESEKRCKELQEEEDSWCAAAGEKEEEENSGNQVETMKKELIKYRRMNKRKEQEIEVVREERNKALQEKLEHVRTIRNLNDSLDLLKRINVEHEKANVSQDNNTKTRRPMSVPQDEGRQRELDDLNEEEDDEYDVLDSYETDDEEYYDCDLDVPEVPDEDETEASGEEETIQRRERIDEGNNCNGANNQDIQTNRGTRRSEESNTHRSGLTRMRVSREKDSREELGARNHKGARGMVHDCNQKELGSTKYKDGKDNRQKETRHLSRYGDQYINIPQSNHNRKKDKEHENRRSIENSDGYRNRNRTMQENNRNKDQSNRERKDSRNEYKKKVVCRYFLEDRCNFDKEECWYSHDERDVMEEANKLKAHVSFLESSIQRKNYP